MTLGKDFFKEFPPISTEQWMDKINADLKGADFNRKLVWRTQEGFNVNPFYRSEDLEEINHLGTLPGEFPFVRGNKKGKNDWFIRQDIKVNDLKEANKKALNVLMRGADSIGFILDCKKEYTKEDIKTLINEFHLEVIEVNFMNASGKVLPHFVEIVDELGVDKTKVRGGVCFAPFKRLNCKGSFKSTAKEQFEKAKMLIEVSKDLPNFKVINLQAKVFNNAGSSIIQEVGYSLAMGVELLEGLLAEGLKIEEITPKIRFHYAVGTTYFMEIAKFRALRLLWAKIVEAYKPKNTDYCKMHIHAETSDWNKTVYDPYVNMLRTQTEGMSAVLGGVDSFVLKPFDTVFEESAEFSERIARNQQLLLKEEVNLDKVVDPAGGAYYIEYLTQAIAEHGWDIFLQVQDLGGYIKAFNEGFVKKHITETARKRDMNIATRRENLLGTNQFPNFEEMITNKDKIADKNTCCCSSKSNDNGLEIYRGAEAFEELRLKTDAYSEKNGRPKVQMLTIGHLNMRKARAQFACNFFACAGFEVHDHNGFNSIEEGVKYCEEQKAKIVVLCSSDDEYATLAPEAYEKLDKDVIFVVAGAPACMDELKEKGITNFVHVKCNLLETLQQYQSKLGI
ncbi:heterodimeric methylmalonyl-CoA mutase small subunit [Balneicella halophila]|uniref:Heterodimeric methylmalonyl-CoA mutase small subunit n=1 Tax=Balneicella halophila TaxID=1537566 RepID=A0A7L4UMS0_BALHA|nr:methylmalonyl-CoA mutase family protein [Balneicella halophila]PVX49926.1 heterodimeric methylmalonyl-CoA mutase small subunit [Balneicella halophila]